MIKIDPLSIALQGIYAGSKPLNMVLNGWQVEIVINDSPAPNVQPKPVPDYYAGIGVGGGVSTNKIYRQPEQKKVKIVTVTCEKDGVVLKKSKKFKDINVSIDNIEVEIIETKNKPRINIKLAK